MLVLSRKLGEQIVIGDNVCVTVIAVRGNKVQLGFSAPLEVSIRREELSGCPEGQTNQRGQSDFYDGTSTPDVQP